MQGAWGLADMQRLIHSAFRNREWGGALEAWYEALGVSVLLIDATHDVVLRSGPRSGFCDLMHAGLIDNVPFECLSTDVAGFCRGGTPYRLLPLYLDGAVVARVLICGYTTSAEQRRGVAKRLAEAGLSPSEARALVRGIPVIPKRRLAAVERMVLHQASALLEKAVSDRAGASEGFIESLGALVRESSVAPDDVGPVAAWLLGEAIRAVGGTGGQLALVDAGSGELRTEAERGEASPAGATAMRRAFRSGRSSVGAVPSAVEEHASSVCVPLAVEHCRIGVVCVTLPVLDASEGVAALEHFAAGAATVLDAASSRRARDREVYELLQIDEVARALHRGVEVDDIAPLVASVLDKAIDMGIGGIALTGYGTDRAAVVVNGEVSSADVEAVISEAVGRDSTEDLELSVSSYQGEVLDSGTAGEWTVLSVPLAAQDAVIGYLFAARHESHGFGSEDQRLLERLGGHVAIAFNRSALFGRLRDDYRRAIDVLSAALDASEGMKRGHSGEVMRYAVRIGEELSLCAEDLKVLHFAGLVHDIGKIGISEEVLLKPAGLDEAEMAQVRRHSEIGASLLEQVGFLNAVAPAVLHHHEHWDGTGYPMKLSGEDIPLLSRILAVADAYASMTADTPYRAALSSTQAQSELVAAGGTLFDPRVVAAMTMVLQRMHTAGLSGLLSKTEGPGEYLPA